VDRPSDDQEQHFRAARLGTRTRQWLQWQSSDSPPEYAYSGRPSCPTLTYRDRPTSH
jgi:hypothetical protein